jgi:hypothetical protein
MLKVTLSEVKLAYNSSCKQFYSTSIEGGDGLEEGGENRMLLSAGWQIHRNRISQCSWRTYAT